MQRKVSLYGRPDFKRNTLEEISPVSIETWINNIHPEDLEARNKVLEKHLKGELDSKL